MRGLRGADQITLAAIAAFCCAVVSSIGVLSSRSELLARSHFQQQDFGYVVIAQRYFPCGPGPVWSADFGWIGFDILADQDDSPGRGRLLVAGRLCRVGLSDRWKFYETSHSCFDYARRAWAPLNPGENCTREFRTSLSFMP